MKEHFLIRNINLIFIINFFKNYTIRKKSIELTINIFIKVFLEVWNWFLILMFFSRLFFNSLAFIFSNYFIRNNFIMLIILTLIDLLIIKIFIFNTLIFKFIKLLVLFEFTVKMKWWASFKFFIRSIFLCLLSMKFVFIIYFHPIILIITFLLLWRTKICFLIKGVLVISFLRRPKIKFFILEIWIIILI